MWEIPRGINPVSRVGPQERSAHHQIELSPTVHLSLGYISQDWKSSFPNRSVCWIRLKQIGNDTEAPDRNTFSLRVGDSETSRSPPQALDFKNYSSLFIKASIPFSDLCYKVSKTVEYLNANQSRRRSLSVIITPVG